MKRDDSAPELPPPDEATGAAAAWLLRHEEGLNAAEAAEFARWRARDPRHVAAFEQVRAMRNLLRRLPTTAAGTALVAEADELLQRKRRTTGLRYGWRTAVALAAAACITAAIWLAWPAIDPGRGVYATATGQRQFVTLTDGSTVVLNGDSEVEVAFARAERRVQLHRGEAHFFVATDPARTFVVSADSVTIRAIGTAFNVRREVTAIEVLVTEGKVQVTHRNDASETDPALQPIYLVSGESVHIDTFSKAVAVAAAGSTPGEKLLRPAPRLVFTNTPLAEVVSLFNRYNEVQMEIAEPELGRRAVGGNFDADNAESFIALLSTSGDVRIERISPTQVRLLKAP